MIEGCLERDPSQRFPSVAAVIQELRGLLRELPDDAVRGAKRRTMPTIAERTEPDIDSTSDAVNESTLTTPPADVPVDLSERAIYEWGYQVERHLGRVKDHSIFLAAPRADMVAAGSFPDANIFPSSSR